MLCAINGDFFQTWSLSQASVAALVKEHFSSGEISENYDNVHDMRFMVTMVMVIMTRTMMTTMILVLRILRLLECGQRQFHADDINSHSHYFAPSYISEFPTKNGAIVNNISTASLK